MIDFRFRGIASGIWWSAVLLGMLLVLGCGGDSNDGFDVQIESSINESNAPVRVAFRASSQAPLDAELIYTWSFGDGNTSSAAEPEHVFTDAGRYEVTLSIYASNGKTGRASTTIILAESADLVVQNVQVSSNRPAPGEDFEVTWLISNLGEAPATAWSTGIFLSADEVFDAQDTRIGGSTAMSGELSVEGEGRSSTVTIPENQASGDWFLIVVADDENRVGDAQRDNNVALLSTPLRIRGSSDSGADLIVCELGIDGIDNLPADVVPTVERTDQLTLSVCITNLGDRPASGSRYAIYLSEDETLDAEDLKVGDRPGEALGVGDRFVVDEPVDFSNATADRTWHIIVEVDPNDETAEQREDNNTRVYSKAISVVEGGAVEGVDLLVPSVSVEQTRVYWGQVFSGSVIVQNRGSDSVQRLFLVRLSLEPSDGGEPVSLTSLNLNGIEAGSSREEAFETTLSQRISEGEYTLVAHVDPTNSVGDVNEANNRRFLNETLNLGGEPNVDLVPLDVQIGADSIAAGESLTVRTRVANEGIDGSGPFDVALILSRDNAGSVDDITLGQFRIDNLDGGTESEVEQSVVIPADIDQAVDIWLVGASVDPANQVRGESREDNNIRFSSTQLTVAGATGGCNEDDLEPNDMASEASEVMPGILENLGSCSNSDWFVVEVPEDSLIEIVGRENTLTSTLRVRLVDTVGQTVAEAPIGNSVVRTFALTEAESERIFIEVLSASPEVSYDLEINVLDRAEESRLKLRDIGVLPTVAQAGQQVQVSGELVNVGLVESPFTTTWFFLSSSAEILGGTFLNNQSEVPLAAGAARPFSMVTTIPQSLEDGSYFVVGRPDSGGDIGNGTTDDESWAKLVVSQADACTADQFEPNRSPHLDGSMGNVIVGNLEAGSFQNVHVCANDDDWYAVQLETDQRLEVQVDYTVANGDVELALYGPDGLTILNQSASLLGTESLELPRVMTSGQYYLRVYLKAGSGTENSYSISVLIGDANACPDDQYEPNSTRLNAQLLRDGTHDLYLCAGDEDWYRFAIAAGNTVSWQLTSGNAPLRMYLFDESGLVGEDDRRLVHQARRNGDHFVQVVADTPGEYAYQIRSSGVSGIDLVATGISTSRQVVSPGEDFRVTGGVENRRGDIADDVSIDIYIAAVADGYEDGIRLGGTTIPQVSGASTAAFSARLTMPTAEELSAVGLSIPAGAAITVVVDLQRLVPDSQFSNNVGSASIAIESACMDDDDNENEGLATSTVLNWSSTSRNGVLCGYTEDWFELQPPSDGTVSLSLSFADDDLDLFIYDSTSGVIVSAASEGSPEVVSFVYELTTGPVFVRVDGFEDGQSNYVLSWEISE